MREVVDERARTQRPVPPGVEQYDSRRRIAIGGESGLGRRLQVRGGLRFDVEAPDEVVPAAGASFAVSRRLWLDFQVTLGTSERDQGWGIGGRFVM